MKSLVITFFLTLSPLLASEVKLKESPKSRFAQILVHEVEWLSLDVFKLKIPARLSRDHDLFLVCSFNNFYANYVPYSTLILSPDDFMYRGTRYQMSDKGCLDLFNFFKQGFEKVSKDDPLLIKFDLHKNAVVEVTWKNQMSASKPRLSYISPL